MPRHKIGLGSRLKTLREEKNYAQRQVAERIGVKVSTYSSWETGRTHPRELRIFSDLANLYDCSIDYLLCRTDERRIPRNAWLPCSGTFFQQAMQKNRKAKHLLAAYVVKYLIEPGDRLLLNIGSTLTIFAIELRKSGIGGLKVASHSISVPLQLMESAIEYVQLGGVLHRSEAAVLPTKEMPSGWFPWAGPYKAVITAESFSIENGAATTDPQIALLDQRYTADADKIIMILDHSKFFVKAGATTTMCGIAPEKTEWLSEKKKFTLITEVDWDNRGEAEEYEKLANKIVPKIPEDKEFSSVRIFESVLIPKSLENSKTG